VAASLPHARSARDVRATLRRTSREVVEGFSRHRLLTYASAIAYQLVSSVIPFACFTLALLGVLNADELWTDHLAPQVVQHTSREVSALLDTTVREVLGRKQGFWVSAGFVVALWEISGAMRATIEALDDIYGVGEHRSRSHRYAISVLLAAMVGALTVAALGFVFVGPSIGGGGLLVGALSYLAAAALLVVAVGLTLRLAPSTRQPVRWIGLGSVVIVGGWLAVVGAYIFYATVIASYSSIFGSLAVVFLLIVAIYLSAVVFLVGVLIDASARDEKR